MTELRDRAAIIGIGNTEYTRGTEASQMELDLRAISAAATDAGIKASEIDGIIPSHRGASAEALAANVTNELGVEGSIRLLKNVTGLWLLEECRRWWGAHGEPSSAGDLVAAAEDVPGGRSVIDPDDPRFGPPGDLPVRIAAACAESGQPVPASPAETTRVILDSLALAWRRTRTCRRTSSTRRSARRLATPASQQSQ